jgi:hypothetical protein
MNRLSRRELLTTLLGGTVAAVACRGRPVTPRFGGRLLGQSADRGHRVRDAQLPTTTAPPRKAGVVIIGAGPAGLSAARRLRQAGFDDFVVLELEDQPGGTSAWGANEVSAYPWGAHYVPVPLPTSRALLELFTEMKVIEGTDARGLPIVAEELLCRAPQERLFFLNAWQEGLYPRAGASREDLRQLHAFNAEVARWAAFRDANGRRAFTIPSVDSGDGPDLDALDRISMGDWLRQKGWTSRRLQWFVEYGCRDDYGSLLDTTSAWAGLFYFGARLDKPGGKGAEFITWPEGNGHIVRYLSTLAGERLRNGVGVTGLHARAESVWIDAFDFRAKQPLCFEAGQVILAVSRPVAVRLLPEWRATPPTFADPTYSSWMVANITLRNRPVERTFPLCWDNVLYDSKGLGYVVATHQTGKDFGSTVWTYYLPLLDGTPREQREILLGASWQHWVDVILSDLTRAHPDLPPLIEAIDVWRWGHAMVRPTVGLMRGDLLPQARLPYGRIHFAHTDLSGMALFEEAQHWGIAAAEAVLAELPFRSHSSGGSP